MKLKNTLILLIVFSLLAGYVYFIEIKKYEKAEQVKEESKKVFNLVKDSIDAIDIQNNNGNFTIKKIQGEWRITEPLYTPADESAINSMLSTLLNAKKEKEFIVRPHEFAEFGLSDKAIFIQLRTTEGSQDSIRFGDKTPVGSYVFSYKADSSVFTTAQNVKNTFDKKLFDIRDRELLHFKRSEVVKITLRNRFGKFEFEKSGGSDWIIQNIARPADNGKMSSLLSKLENNRVKAFVDEEGTQLKRYGLLRPAYQIDLLLGTERGQKRFLISKKIDGKYYAKDDSRKPLFEIDSALVKDVNKKLNEFRSKDLASFNRSDVNRITLRYGDTLFTCIKDTNDNWVMDDTTGRAVKKTKINSFFSGIDYTNISEFVNDGKYNAAKYGFVNPSLKVSLFKDKDLLLEAILGKIKSDNVYASTNSYDSVYLIPKSKLKDLKLKLDDILEPVEKDGEEEAIS